MEEKRLTRSLVDRKIAGVCGGLGEYLNVDSSLIRLIWAAMILCGGSGALLYLVAAFILPEGEY